MFNIFRFERVQTMAAITAFMATQEVKQRQAKQHRTGRGVRNPHKAGGRSWAPHQVRKVWNDHV